MSESKPALVASLLEIEASLEAPALDAPALESIPPILLALDLRVRTDTGSPGFEGQLWLGVEELGRVVWWVVELGQVVHTRFTERPPKNAGAVVLFSAADASQIVATGNLRPGSELVSASGDVGLFERFVNRYGKGRDSLSVRGWQTAAGKRK
ncbi:MAG: hypothetical protein HY791_05635 [Deltaproteobacteria bacterium]|nr:hypothetical protein [Deltaproteobacteria bacterium]